MLTETGVWAVSGGSGLRLETTCACVCATSAHIRCVLGTGFQSAMVIQTDAKCILILMGTRKWAKASTLPDAARC